MTDEPTPPPPAPSRPESTSQPPVLPAQPAGRNPLAGYQPLDGDPDFPNVLNKLLKKPLSLVHHLETSEESGRIPLRLLGITLACLAIFGVVVGSFSGGHQLWAAPVKIMGGLLFSGLICVPSLYIFTCLGGLEAKFRTIAGVMTALIALSSVLLVGFAPVVWLFSVSSSSATFLGFLLLALWLICSGFGLLIVTRAGRALGMRNTSHLGLWCVVFLMVTIQMTTTLRPILGPAAEHFINFREKKFFLQYWSEQFQAESDAAARVP